MKKRLIAQSFEVQDSASIISVNDAEDAIKALGIDNFKRRMPANDDKADYGVYGFANNGNLPKTYYYIETYQYDNDKLIAVYKTKKNNEQWGDIKTENLTMRSKDLKNANSITIDGKNVILTSAKTFNDLLNGEVVE